MEGLTEKQLKASWFHFVRHMKIAYKDKNLKDPTSRAQHFKNFVIHCKDKDGHKRGYTFNPKTNLYYWKFR